ncbi:MAG TPA: glycosyltransferase [Oculatellaceae cyanobacterium]|jgi:glycosyltransferase involved in cell wall biosynthesis
MLENHQPVKIMHVITRVGSGGVERRRLLIAKGLDQTKFYQKIVCLDARNSLLLSDLQQAGVEVIDLNGKGSIFDAKALFRIYQEIKRWQPNIVHCALFEGMVLGGLAAIASGNNKLILEDTSDLYGNPRSNQTKLLLGAIAKYASAYIAISPTVGQYLIQEQKVPEKLVKIICNGVSETKKPPGSETLAEKQRLGLPADAVIVGSVGRIENRVKRFTDIIDAISLTSESINNLYLLIVGEGEDQAMLEEYAIQKNVKERVIFTGYRHDLDMVYSLMDIFVLASAYEGFGLVLVEAMFSSLPVIATNVGGIPSIVIDEKTGILIPPLNPEVLAKALIKLYNSPELRAQMGTLGRQRAIDSFTEQRYVQEIKNLYCNLLNTTN